MSCLAVANIIQILTNHVLNNLCLGKTIHAKIRHSYLYQSQVTTEFTLEEELKTRYVFHSEDTYYYFLLQHFLASKQTLPGVHSVVGCSCLRSERKQNNTTPQRGCAAAVP